MDLEQYLCVQRLETLDELKRQYLQALTKLKREAILQNMLLEALTFKVTHHILFASLLIASICSIEASIPP